MTLQSALKFSKEKVIFMWTLVDYQQSYEFIVGFSFTAHKVLYSLRSPGTQWQITPTSFEISTRVAYDTNITSLLKHWSYLISLYKFIDMKFWFHSTTELKKMLPSLQICSHFLCHAGKIQVMLIDLDGSTVRKLSELTRLSMDGSMLICRHLVYTGNNGDINCS